MGRKESRRKENKWQRSVREPIRDTRGEQRLSFAPFARDTKTMGKELLPIYFEKGEKDTMVDLNRAAEGSS